MEVAVQEVWMNGITPIEIVFGQTLQLCQVFIKHHPSIPVGMYEPVFSQEELDIRMSHYEY